MANTGLLDTLLVGSIRFRRNLGGKLGIEGFQHLCAQREVGCKLACRAGYTCRGVHASSFTTALLGFTAAEIDGSAQSRTVSVIYGILAWNAHAGMVAVISNLIVELARFRIHAVQPIQSPFNFINNIGYTISSWPSVGVIGVAEGLWILLVGKEHLIDGVGGGGGVLQIVTGVMPTSSDVQMLPRFGGVIDNVPIMYVATVVQVRIVATPLLTHVV